MELGKCPSTERRRGDPSTSVSQSVRMGLGRTLRYRPHSSSMVKLDRPAHPYLTACCSPQIHSSQADEEGSCKFSTTSTV